MMDKAEARARILRLNDEHERDHDGGYALVGAIKRAGEEVEPESRDLLSEALQEFVRAQDPQLWAVALEALVQLGGGKQVASLVSEMTAHDEKWQDYLVLALLRLGQQTFRDLILKHVHDSMKHPRNLTIPIVAALCRIDREACLEIAATYFDDMHAAGQATDAEGFIPAFVRNLVAVDEGLLAELVRRLFERQTEAGHWLSLCFNAYLSKPWMEKELGKDRSLRLRREAIDAARDVGAN